MELQRQRMGLSRIPAVIFFIAAIVAQSTTITIPIIFRPQFIGTLEILPLLYMVVFIITCVLASYLFWRKNFFKGIFSNKLNVKDRFSELPIEVSYQIISHVSIREVAKISTLSRHWRNVCLVLPCLDLDWFAITGLPRSKFHTSSSLPHEQAFVKNVDQVLEMNRNNKHIQSFHLSCWVKSKVDGGVIDRWMNFVAANKGLQSLTLQFMSYKVVKGLSNLTRKAEEFHLVTGSFLFQFSHLTSLHLGACILRLEKDFKLPNLTILELNNVILEESQWQGVLSCSSIIERLCVRNCYLPSKLCIGSNFPCLSFLMISKCPNLRELEVSAWNLQKFDLNTNEHLKCSFFNVPNLKQVYLDPWRPSSGQDILNNLAVEVPSLKYLSLKGICPLLMHTLPSNKANFFYSVLRLHISMEFDTGNIMENFPRIFNCFPQLKELEMKLPADSLCKTYELLVPHADAHTKLEYIEMLGLQIKYISIAMFFLKNAGALKRMVVTKALKRLQGFSSDIRYSIRERFFIQRALTGKASSTNVELIVE